MNLSVQIKVLAGLAIKQETDAAEAMKFSQAAQNLAQAQAVLAAIIPKPADEADEVRAVGLRVVAFRVEAGRLKDSGMDAAEAFSRLCFENLNLEYKGTEYEIRGIVNSVFYKKLD
ncbi:MAG: hypothetical protein HRT86_11535 [Ilumatobacteraceae bacterium]|nr:hypothetical protein [Ilumatobacteraceae bacterium]